MEDFWEVNNPYLYCWDITIPVMCVNATDDPIISKDLIPCNTFKQDNKIEYSYFSLFLQL